MEPLRLWDFAASKTTRRFEGDTKDVLSECFSPNHSNPEFESCGWDRTVKVWNSVNCKFKNNHHGHNGYLNTVTVSQDGSLCTSSGKDAEALNDGKNLYTLEHNDIINAFSFSLNRYWLRVVYGPSIKIWDLACKKTVEELRPDQPLCMSLAWSIDGQTLFAGYSNNTICVWQVSVSAH